tara:strand:- start:2763 stop:4682 length:1920 start_codon:yes stop_codon:yes gene_type:complete
MPLKKLNFVPGFNKQVTASGAEGQWIDGDFVRFRSGLPEKIGGWKQLTAAQKELPGVARAQHAFTSLSGEKYTAIGTSQGLFLYYDEDFYDITPLATGISGATFTSTNNNATVTINKASHGLAIGRYVTFSSVTLPGGGATGYAVADFTGKTYEVITSATNSFTITMSAVESGTGMTAAGAATIDPYEIIGPTFQTTGYGWSTYLWGDSTWGTARTTSDVVLDPANWSLDNFGEVLVATIHNGKTFTWNAGASSARTIRASTSTSSFATTNNPTASIMTLVSDRDRHLFHLGTETTIGTPATQDPMFIRFSNQEDLNSYTPTATNTAGTFRLDAGSEIRGAVNAKDYTLVLTDRAAYTIQFVGPPFTFSIRQVGTNCGCISQHGIVYANGAVYWMGDAGGFFVFDGTVKSLPCLVEDFVFTTDGDNLGLNFSATQTIAAGYNSLYDEVMWFYPKSGSDQIDRVVTYNYAENVWTTGSLARTTYVDAYVFNNPYATEYASSGTPNFPIQGITNTYGATTYYAHEEGTDQVADGASTAIPAFITSGDLDIDDGEIFSSVRRFIPDYKYLTGNSKITLFLNDFPNNAQASSPLGPFTVTSSTDKVDTRARGRLIAIKIENESTGETWRYGTLRLDAQPDGRR